MMTAFNQEKALVGAFFVIVKSSRTFAWSSTGLQSADITSEGNYSSSTAAVSADWSCVLCLLLTSSGNLVQWGPARAGQPPGSISRVPQFWHKHSQYLEKPPSPTSASAFSPQRHLNRQNPYNCPWIKIFAYLIHVACLNACYSGCLRNTYFQ